MMCVLAPIGQDLTDGCSGDADALADASRPSTGDELLARLLWFQAAKIQYAIPTANDANACSRDIRPEERKYQYPTVANGMYTTTEVTTPGEYLLVLMTLRIWKKELKKTTAAMESHSAMPRRGSRRSGSVHRTTRAMLTMTRYLVVKLAASDAL